MQTTSYRVNDKMFLNCVTDFAVSPAAVINKNTAHVIVLDCSGSMAQDLPRVREQLKTRLRTMVRDDDTVSIVWFSGKGQYGTLVEGASLSNANDLKLLCDQVDRWLRPIGLTGFKEPLLEVAKVAERLSKKHPVSLVWCTDGVENQWSRAEVMSALDKAKEHVLSSVFFEVGYYADRPMLTAMAERAGGSLVHASDFDKYEVSLTDALARRALGGKKVEVQLPNTDYIGGIAFSLDAGSIGTYAIDGNTVRVPEGLDSVWFLSPSGSGTSLESISKGQGSEPELAAAYAAISLFATRMKPEVVRPLLKATGDVALIESYQNCFGKQAYSAFMDTAKAAAFGTGRWTKGWDPNKVPADDAFTVLDLLKLLASDDDNRVLLNHEAFKYNKIGRGRVDANTVLTDEEQAEVEVLTSKLVGLKDLAEVKKVTAQIEAITNKPEALKFEETKNTEGYPVSALTYNEERPNVSILVKKSGTVQLGSRKDKPADVPMEFETFIYRNYAIVKDGLVNVETLPTKLSGKTIEDLTGQVKAGKLAADVFKTKGKVVDGKFEPDEVIIDLTKLPVINAQMVKSCSAKALFTAEYELTKAKAAQKVFNSYLKEKKPESKKSEGWEAKYGPEATSWLKEQGFTEYSGFAPKSVAAESVDFYMAKEMSVSLKGLASLPTLKDVKDRMAKGKLTASASLMAGFVTEIESAISGKSDSDAVAVIEGLAEQQKNRVRDLIFTKATGLFAITVGQQWPSEWKGVEENTLTLSFDGNDVECKLEMLEKKQAI